MKLRPLTSTDVTISVTAEFETLDYRKEYEKDVADGIAAAVKEHGLWGWCAVWVTVRYKGFEADDCLGGCSYTDEEDFKSCDYYTDMVNTCLSNLNEQLNDLFKDLIIT